MGLWAPIRVPVQTVTTSRGPKGQNDNFCGTHFGTLFCQKAYQVMSLKVPWNTACQTAAKWCPFGVLKTLKTTLLLQRECVWRFWASSTQSPEIGLEMDSFWRPWAPANAQKGFPEGAPQNGKNSQRVRGVLRKPGGARGGGGGVWRVWS